MSPTNLVIFSSFSLVRVFCFYECFQAGEVSMPEDAIVLQPGVDFFQRLGIEIVPTAPSFAPLLYQVRTPQQAQMPRNRGPRNREGAGDLTSGLAAAPKHIKDGAPGWVRQGLESSFARICNLAATHNA
jgi:hypothetical protein